MMPLPTKAELRAHYRALRLKNIPDVPEIAAVQMAQHFLSAFSLGGGTVVSAYFPMRAEISPLPLMSLLREAGCITVLPVARARAQPLIFRFYDGRTTLTKGSFGVMEPTPAQREMVPDVMIVPLLAFDDSGTRLGYGAGHFDMTIAGIKQARPVQTIGIAYDFQRAPHLPAESHDQRLDAVITDQAVYHCKRAGA